MLTEQAYIYVNDPRSYGSQSIISSCWIVHLPGRVHQLCMYEGGGLFSFVSPQYCRVHRCAGIAIKSGIAITSFGLRPSPLGQVLHLKKIAFRVPFQSDKF